MSESITVECQVHFKTGRRSRKTLQQGAAKPDPPNDRVPRVAKLLALAIKFDKLLQEGVVRDQAKLARLGHVTRARMSQIMDLVLLSPRIQEDILFLPSIRQGRDKITEKHLRSVVAELDWHKQEELWKAISKF